MLNMNGVRSSYYRSEYVNGSAVRKERPLGNVQPKREPRVREEQRRRQLAEEQRRAKGLTMNAPHVAFLALVSIVCLIVCFSYLYVQSNITVTRESISQLKNDISTVQSQNNALNYSINSYVNVDHVYKVATKKLGMKQATDKQIFNYKASNRGYTLQYGEIPNK